MIGFLIYLKYQQVLLREWLFKQLSPFYTSPEFTIIFTKIWIRRKISCFLHFISYYCFFYLSFTFIFLFVLFSCFSICAMLSWNKFNNDDYSHNFRARFFWKIWLPIKYWILFFFHFLTNSVSVISTPGLSPSFFLHFNIYVPFVLY